MSDFLRFPNGRVLPISRILEIFPKFTLEKKAEFIPAKGLTDEPIVRIISQIHIDYFVSFQGIDQKTIKTGKFTSLDWPLPDTITNLEDSVVYSSLSSDQIEKLDNRLTKMRIYLKQQESIPTIPAPLSTDNLPLEEEEVLDELRRHNFEKRTKFCQKMIGSWQKTETFAEDKSLLEHLESLAPNLLPPETLQGVCENMLKSITYF